MTALDGVDGVIDGALDDREMYDCDRRSKLDAWRGGSRSVDERGCSPLIPHAHRIIFSRVSGTGMQGGGEQGDGE